MIIIIIWIKCWYWWTTTKWFCWLFMFYIKCIKMFTIIIITITTYFSFWMWWSLKIKKKSDRKKKDNQVVVFFHHLFYRFHFICNVTKIKKQTKWILLSLGFFWFPFPGNEYVPKLIKSTHQRPARWRKVI